MRQKRLAAMLLALCFMLVFAASSAFAASPQDHPFKPVQVFDVNAGKVVLTTPNDKEYQEFANKWIASVTGPAPQLTNDDSCNYVYRVPLEKPVTISVSGTKLLADDVFMFYCDGKPPLLLVFDEQRRPFLLLFKEDIKPFIKKIGIPAS